MTGAHAPREAGVGWTDRPADEVASGSILGGKYRLISEIGRGGMGSVWRAEHLGWDAPVALKLMNRDITAHPEAVARFEREVRLAAGLRSPHVVQVLDHGVDAETRTPFIAMELLEGESLARRLKRACLSPAEMFDVFAQLVRALSRAHAAGIVHRDLKPDNVFLVRNDEESLAKVLDFGVAKWTAPDILESGLTRPGSVVGTPYYMSPEQIQGSPEIDHRTDLWALAAIACECLTGRRPFEAPDFAQLAVLLLGNLGRPLPSSLGQVPPGFDAWFLRATDPDINRRFQSAREMAQSLAAVCDAAPSSGSDPVYPSHLPTSTRQELPSMAPVSNTASSLALSSTLWQRPMAKLVGTTVVTTLIGMGVIGYWVASRGSRAASPPPASVTTTQVTPSNPPQTGGPGVRPIHASDVEPGPHVTPTPSVDSLASPPRASVTAQDDFDREETERRVRAARLDRGRVTPTKARRSTNGSTARVKPPAPEASPIAAPPPPAVAQPEAPKAPPPEPASNVVDGRRIRTSL